MKWSTFEIEKNQLICKRVYYRKDNKTIQLLCDLFDFCCLLKEFDLE